VVFWGLTPDKMVKSRIICGFPHNLDSTRLFTEAQQDQYNQDQPNKIITHKKVPQDTFPP